MPGHVGGRHVGRVGRGVLQPSDYALVQLGGIAYPDVTDPTGSMLSLGFQYAQLDIGFRDHWWSPMSDSSMLIGTQARTMPGITLSNYTPITKLGFRYEAFIAEMSHIDDIAFEGGTTSGRPRLAGLQVEDVAGARLDAECEPPPAVRRRRARRFVQRICSMPSSSRARYDNGQRRSRRSREFGNQTAAVTSSSYSPPRNPFSVYFQYAGEDGSRGGGLAAGQRLVVRGRRSSRGCGIASISLTKISDWQNGWYVHHIYPEGQSNHGHVIGHWGGDDRALEDGVGAQSHSLRVGWMPSFGGRFELRYRTLANKDYSAVDYEREHELALRSSRSSRQFVYGAEFDVGGRGGMCSASTSGASAAFCVSHPASPKWAAARWNRGRAI